MIGEYALRQADLYFWKQGETRLLRPSVRTPFSLAFRFYRTYRCDLDHEHSQADCISRPESSPTYGDSHDPFESISDFDGRTTRIGDAVWRASPCENPEDGPNLHPRTDPG